MRADRFGNIQLTATREDVEAAGMRLGSSVPVRLASGQTHLARFVRAFAQAAPGELILYEDANRRLAVAVSHGSAAELLGLAAGAQLTIGEV
jgi:hypothetical protein